MNIKHAAGLTDMGPPFYLGSFNALKMRDILSFVLIQEYSARMPIVSTKKNGLTIHGFHFRSIQMKRVSQ